MSKLKVFIDGGAHKGEAIEMLLDKRPDMDGCEIHFFEPNEDLIPELKAIKDDRYDITVYHSALWAEDGEIDFLNSVGRWGTLGGTTVPSIQEKWGLEFDRKNPNKVKAVSLSGFLEELLIKNQDEDCYIVVKLDIEGSEYFVIDDLFRTNMIDEIDELYIEWHDHFFPHFKALGDDLRNKLALANVEVHNDWV
tara:strand:- start:63140 stop:63721 length:582 start_codon:yes stop_codon:yes gene_type:complete